MADSTTPTPDPAPKKRKAPGPLNQMMLDRLQNDEEIINAALDEANK